MHTLISGISGRAYTYQTYDRFDDWLEVPANYAFGYLSPGIGGGWTFVYFGEAENIKQRMSGHERWLEAVALGATYVLGHANHGGDVARKAEERDLIARHNPILNVRHRTNHLVGLGSPTGLALSSFGGLDDALRGGLLGYALGFPTRHGIR
jgi:hypothetical protein